VLPPVKEEEESFDDIAPGITVQERAIITDISRYQKPVGKEQRETRQVHIEHHMAASSHSLVGNGKSVSALGENGEQFAGLLWQVNDLLSLTDPEWTREYLEGGEIVRLTLLADGMIERTVIKAKPGPGGHELVTTFDNISVQKALNRYGRKSG
jgi:hypothetical protein